MGKRGKNPADYDNVREVENSTNSLITEAMQVYHNELGNKLPNCAAVAQWLKAWNIFRQINI